MGEMSIATDSLKIAVNFDIFSDLKGTGILDLNSDRQNQNILSDIT